MDYTSLNGAVADELAVTVDTTTLLSEARARRRAAVLEAMAWRSGKSLKRQEHHRIAESDHAKPNRTVRLSKPGKEVFRSKKPHPQDMTPRVWRGQSKIQTPPTFRELFSSLEVLKTSEQGRQALELLAALLVRQAFMLHHKDETPGKWRLILPVAVLDEIDALVPLIGPLLPWEFLHLCDAIAWNEDVKYLGLRDGGVGLRDKLSWDQGRQNNLMTLAHYAAHLLGRTTASALAGGFSLGAVGVSPIDLREAMRVFPLLHGAGWRSCAALLTAEQELVDRLTELIGMTADELAMHLRIDDLDPDGRAYEATLTERAARCLCSRRSTDLLNSPLRLKTVRLRANGKPSELINFATLHPTRILDETWESSLLRQEGARRMICVVYGPDRHAKERIVRVVGLSLTNYELDTRLKAVWTKAQKAVREERWNRLPKKSDDEKAMCIVNTRDQDALASQTAKGAAITGRLFCLTKEHFLKMLARA